MNMMKHRIAACLLLAGMLMMGAVASAQTTYVFPYEGFRYTQQEDEIVLTQTNLDSHAELIDSLGTTADAMLASYMARGVAMEVLGEDGGQIAVSVLDAGDFADVQAMSEMTAERLEAFRAQFEQSGLYDSCAVAQTEPVCVKLTTSAMYGETPVYIVRYATLHLGQMIVFEQTVVRDLPDADDEARMASVLGGVKLLSRLAVATPAPTPVPTPTPKPTAVPTPGVAKVVKSEGEMALAELPSFTTDRKLTVSGTTSAHAEVTVAVDSKTIGRVTSGADGAFSVGVTLPQTGDLLLAVMTETSEQMVAIRYEAPAAKLEITGPQETTFTGDNIVIRGETEPEATVFVDDGDDRTSVKANKAGSFSARVYLEKEGARTFTVTARADGFADTAAQITLEREFTERERVAVFRKKMIEAEYDAVARNPERYIGEYFIERGRVMEFADYDGTPCALVCMANPSKGQWYEPMWVILDVSMEVVEGEILTFYLIGEGLTLPADAVYYRSGVSAEAPVMRAAFFTTSR